MVSAQRTRRKILVALVAGSVAMGCGSDSDKPTGGGDGNGDGGTGGEGDSAVTGAKLTLSFSPMYSAYDGEHTFKIPVKVTGATGKLTVTTSPADFVDDDPYTDGVMLTMRKAGDTTVTIKDEKGNSGTAELHVTKATPAEWETGKERYTVGGDAINPDASFPSSGDGGFNFGDGGFNFDAAFPEAGFGGFGDASLPGLNNMAACTSCHRPDGAGSAGDSGMVQVDVEHTPQQTGGYSDDEIIKIFSEGVKPTGSPFRVVNLGGVIPDAIAATIYMGLHKWIVDESVKKGIVVYLRGLEPKPQGAIDFGALRPRGGMTARPADAGAAATDSGTSTVTDAGSDAGATTDAGVDAGT